MTAATPGQAAYEGHPVISAVDMPWEDLDQEDQNGWEASARAVLDLVTPEDIAKSAVAARQPQPAPELAAYETDIASLTDQRNRVSETADQLRAQVRNLRDALERCRDAAGGSPAAVHTIASQALASSPGDDL